MNSNTRIKDVFNLSSKLRTAKLAKTDCRIGEGIITLRINDSMFGDASKGKTYVIPIAPEQDEGGVFMNAVEHMQKILEAAS